MSRLALTFACCRYDRMEAIREGDVVPAGIELNCITLASGREIFDRMVGGQEFDVAELSASEFISLMGRGDCPFVALPVFPSRVFRHVGRPRAPLQVAPQLRCREDATPNSTSRIRPDAGCARTESPRSSSDRYSCQ